MHRGTFIGLFAIVVMASAGSASAATYYVAPMSTDCSPSNGGAGTLSNPWTNLYHAMTRGGLQAGDMLILRGGTYRNTYFGFDADCQFGPYYTTVLPIGVAGTAANQIIIQNYPGEQVIIDGTDAELAGVTWTSCGTNAWQVSGSVWRMTANRTGQMWVGPTGPSDPGTRLRWRDTTSCGSLQAGEFAVGSGGSGLMVRLPSGANPNGLTFGVSCEGGDCAPHPILADGGARYVTVRRNPSGGSFTVKYGRYNLFVDRNAQNLTFDGIDFVGAGTRDYGSCVRVYDGDYVTVRNGICVDVMGEGLQFYGGGPGGSNGDGINITNNVVENMDISLTGRAWVDGGYLGNNLGMSIVIKNCSDCIVRGNRVRDSYGSAISVTTSINSGLRANNVIVEGNTIWNFGYLNSSSGGRTTAGIQFEPQVTGGITGGVIRNNQIHNGMATHGQWEEGIHASAGGTSAITGLLIVNNSISNIGGACINLRENPAAATLRNNVTSTCSMKGNTCNGGSRCNVFLGSENHTHSNNAYWSGQGSHVVVHAGSATYTRDNVQAYESSALRLDPLLTSATDLTPRSNSPLIDAGTNTNCPSVDLLGRPRPQGASCDIGAFEGPAGGGGGTTPPPSPPSNLRILSS